MSARDVVPTSLVALQDPDDPDVITFAPADAAGEELASQWMSARATLDVEEWR